MAKKRARGEWCWEMQVIACGGGCCAPLQDRHECKGKIEQGHIVAEAEGGDDNPDNLIPLCESHNRRNKKSKVPDNRPAGWRERFIQLIAHDVQPRFCVPPVKNDSRQWLAVADVENTEVIAWPKPDLGAEKSLYYSAGAARREAIQLVEKLVDESQTLDPICYPPGERYSTQLRTIAEAYPAHFEIMVREFFRREHYVLGGWSTFCEKPERYLRWALERKRVNDENEKRRREIEAEGLRRNAEAKAERFAAEKREAAQQFKESISLAESLVERGDSNARAFVEQLASLQSTLEKVQADAQLEAFKQSFIPIKGDVDEISARYF
jgi:hypothetical protein